MENRCRGWEAIIPRNSRAVFSTTVLRNCPVRNVKCRSKIVALHKESKIKISNASMFNFLVDNHTSTGKKASRTSPVGTLDGQKDVTANREMAVSMESIAIR